MPKKFFTADCRPSLLMKHTLKHSGDVSEGSEAKIAAKRVILGRTVTFYRNGLRFVEGLTEDESAESELLRFAHASILTGSPVGDKKICYVDATVDPIEIWIYGMPIQRMIQKAKQLVKTKQLNAEFLLEEPIHKILEQKDVRNVRLFGNEFCHTRFPN